MPDAVGKELRRRKAEVKAKTPHGRRDAMIMIVAVIAFVACGLLWGPRAWERHVLRSNLLAPHNSMGGVIDACSKWTWPGIRVLTYSELSQLCDLARQAVTTLGDDAYPCLDARRSLQYELTLRGHSDVSC